jgi:hypothetical protein
MEMYYLYKKGVYGHGVFWIGADLEVGKLKADEAANNDVDDYHDWQLICYKESALVKNVAKGDCDGEIVYRGRRIKDN